METYFSFWTFAMFIFDVLVTIVGFSYMHWSMRQLLERMDQRTARQEAIWQRLFEKADNTERLTQQILTRLADERVTH
jgi:type II secretory pathway component PulL